jgi:hypothetical protein
MGKGFAALKEIQDTRRSPLMPINHIEEAFKLGQWVSDQRDEARDFLSAERIRRLDAIGFVWTNSKVHGKKALRH